MPLDRIVVLHDEIDLPFGEVRSKLGGGLAGHNGLKSLGQGLGGPDFWRVRAGVGRPDSSDPEIVSAHVLGRFSEPREDVVALIGASADEAERLVERIAGGRGGRPRTREPGLVPGEERYAGGAGLMAKPLTSYAVDEAGVALLRLERERPATR